MIKITLISWIVFAITWIETRSSIRSWNLEERAEYDFYKQAPKRTNICILILGTMAVVSIVLTIVTIATW